MIKVVICKIDSLFFQSSQAKLERTAFLVLKFPDPYMTLFPGPPRGI